MGLWWRLRRWVGDRGEWQGDLSDEMHLRSTEASFPGRRHLSSRRAHHLPSRRSFVRFLAVFLAAAGALLGLVLLIAVLGSLLG